MRIGYLECFSGISGDMLLGAMVDAGVPFSSLQATAAELNIGARLEMRKLTRGGLSATKVDVIAPEPDSNETAHSHQHSDSHAHEPHSHEHESPSQVHSHAAHRSLSTIVSLIRSAALPEVIKERAVHAFQLLGEAEAAIHCVPVEEIHFHEVGALDTIVDIVCCAAGCELLGVEQWFCSSLNVGSGTVSCAHGRLPVPAPATLALLGDAPVYAAGHAMERITPTGAVLLRMLEVQYAVLPAMRIRSTGYGAGGREIAGEPNLLRLLVGEADGDDGPTERVGVIETVIDDANPQLLGYVSDLLLAAGALDVYRTDVQMKKGRRGIHMTVLCHPDQVNSMRDLLFRETTTIGVHWRVENKVSLRREFMDVATPWGTVQMKIARWPSGKIANAAPEYEVCRKIAEHHAIPLKRVMQAAACAYATLSKAD